MYGLSAYYRIPFAVELRRNSTHYKSSQIRRGSIASEPIAKTNTAQRAAQTGGARREQCKTNSARRTAQNRNLATGSARRIAQNRQRTTDGARDEQGKQANACWATDCPASLKFSLL
ncbi:hypothetical protein [uncultured Campylobacter sp.]|uniref:hypothetical protein n=1 Tax=uncultured Campylobacter sp. TaxID=218934 RepID=UPI002614E557|nr:hypothetical protein [uncultured Campylobacter sp.]